MSARYLILIACLSICSCAAADREVEPERREIGSVLRMRFDHSLVEGDLYRVSLRLQCLVDATGLSLTLRARDPARLLDESGVALDELPQWSAAEQAAGGIQTLTAHVRVPPDQQVTLLGVATATTPHAQLREIAALRLPEPDPAAPSDGDDERGIKEHPARLQVEQQPGR